MSPTTLVAMVALGGGLALLVVGLLTRLRERDERLATILDLPYGEQDVDIRSLDESRSPIVESTIDLAGRMVAQFDAKGSLTASLERARIPLRAGEYVIVTIAAGLVVTALLLGLTDVWLFALLGAAITPLGARALLRHRIAQRRKKFESQLPDALTLIASSLSAGHTFLRSIQMMCEESEPPLAEEFARIVAETRLGDPVVDSLGRMAQRLQIRDLDWVVQAIRIQQTVGGKLADLLHTLADFIRAREEVRREVSALTAEGRISAWVLAGLAPFLLVVTQVLNPDYMRPMYEGWGLVALGLTGLSVLLGTAIIFRMVKIEV